MMMMSTLHLPSRSRGFSIVEVLVSAAILGVAVIAIVAMVRKGGDL
ncbi:MAG: prepilin-type N-terminal cleavage/methylation domain-containing protein, partial [Chitinispirillaceae bacterium]|nr:prepilin-type N-terminal cleavage/methylation domain-containing protein [Chitinispirillaceae bacterium]